MNNVRTSVPSAEQFSAPFLEVQNVSKSFRLASTEISVLRGVSFQVDRGSWTTLLGASGSGKTTLLDIIGSLSKPDAGSVRVGGRDVAALSGPALERFRRETVGFVFQAYHILPELNILENVMLPAMLDGKSRRQCRPRAVELLETVGLADRMRHRANELSGGEQQRAAIARALMNEPDLLLADEPTGNLDATTGTGILDIFRRLHAEQGTTIVMVTHDRHVADLADRAIELKNGVIAS